MPKYIALRDTWLSHESRKVSAGEEFETNFPKGPDGKPMVLGDNLKLVKEPTAAEKKAAAEQAEKLEKAVAALDKAKAEGTDEDISKAQAALDALQPSIV